MINIDKLLESKRAEIRFADTRINKEFVKAFRKQNKLTQVALANILGVTKKTIEKWEQGANNINGSSAVLLRLLNDNPELLSQVYHVEFGVVGKHSDEEEFKSIASTVIESPVKASRSYLLSHPFAAMF